ncbi:VOC family protein [Solwaraspora sp. WMMD792]|uniref:VOC family protein n=1 Tax=Solwaraspora sp. WMMD792 TaxID=3016099 RepID=UPI002415E4B0|nr:VOC family protein [Solwaraspora sp. WMMD792]MDG4774388.1 VOC family protein [Solwaraspora sp. WMMD792]
MSVAAAGVPAWVDLGTSDLPGAIRFYGELFGWSAQPPDGPDAEGYTLFSKDDKLVAGAGSVATGGQPPTWTTYIGTLDAQASAKLVESAGGTVLMPPFDVLDRGRAAVFTDPAGASFAVWQPLSMAGAELANVPGSLCWNELTTRDPEGAKEFYGAVFDWETRDTPFPPIMYTEWLVEQQPVAGMMPMVGDDWPADLPAHWMVYFAVNDCDATAEHAAALGGTVSVPPTDLPHGRFAVLNDPQGAFFSVIRIAGD